jgi:hypothetical protein
LSDTERLNDIFDSEDESPSVGVSSELYARLFDEVVTEPISIPEEERALINWYAFDPHRTTMLLRHISRGIETSFNLIVQSALYHGFSMFMHKYSDLVAVIETYEDIALTSDNSNYIDYSHGYMLKMPADKKRMLARTDRETADAMAQIAGTIGCSRTQLASICIYMSLCTSDLMPEVQKARLVKYLEEFDMALQVKSHINEHLTS